MRHEDDDEAAENANSRLYSSEGRLSLSLYISCRTVMKLYRRAAAGILFISFPEFLYESILHLALVKRGERESVGVAHDARWLYQLEI